jgi:spore coat polysaccharide biosynthesis protein SpsF (cytidylyltransferase family)
MEIKRYARSQDRSTRLPGKVLKEINGKSLLEIHLDKEVC